MISIIAVDYGDNLLIASQDVDTANLDGIRKSESKLREFSF